MITPQFMGESEDTPGDAAITPSLWIDVRNQEDTSVSDERRFVAAICGLQALKCSGVRGYGSTEEEAVLNLRRKILHFLDFQAA